MGYNNENASMRWMAFDLETAGREDVIAYLPEPEPDEEPEADGRLKDPDKILADIERKRAKLALERARKWEARIARLSLDPNGCRILALGWQAEDDSQPRVHDAEGDEYYALTGFWMLARNRTLIGFRSRTFDLPVIIQRSRLLGVTVPPLRRVASGRFEKAWRLLVPPYGRSEPHHVDLYDEWTLDGLITRGEVPNNLTTVCKQLGIDIPDDDAKGKDIAALLAAGNLEAVRQHCARDVERTVALARKLGVIPAVAQAEMVL